MFNIKRILMAEVDAAAGGASAPPAAASTTSADVPQAQGAAPTQTKEFSDAVASEVAKILPALKDSIFAEARRTFTEKRNKPAPEPTATPNAAPQPLDAASERRILRDFDRALTKSGLSSKLNDAQWSRAEKLILEERPEDVGTWVKDYFEGYGSAAPPAAPQVVTPPPKPVADLPVSSRGAPAVSQLSPDEMRVTEMSEADKQHYIRTKGMAAFVKKLQGDLKGVQVSMGRR